MPGQNYIFQNLKKISEKSMSKIYSRPRIRIPKIFLSTSGDKNFRKIKNNKNFYNNDNCI